MRRKSVGYSVYHKKQIATNATIRRLNAKPYEPAIVRVQTAEESATLDHARRLVAKLKSKDIFVRDAADTEDLLIVGFYELDNVDEISHSHMARLKKLEDHWTKGASAKRLQKKAAQWKEERRLMEKLGFGPGRLASSVTKQEYKWLLELLTPPPSPRWWGAVVQTQEQAKRLEHQHRRVWETRPGWNYCYWDSNRHDRSHRVQWRSAYARGAWTDEEDCDDDEDTDPVDGWDDKPWTSQVSLFDFVSAALPEAPDCDYDFCDITMVDDSSAGGIETQPACSVM